ncbi:hypothetical protein [Chitinophaga sp. YIM B06452]|uniref:hypothetical protein n=1 Tax=Chitinophaga sp. YIM B06452 TaxID=3082158 RepID=UPI0031FE8AD2
MVDINRLKFSLADVIKIVVNVVFLCGMWFTLSNKVDTLVRVVEGKQMKDDQLHKDQAEESKATAAQFASLTTRVTILEQIIQSSQQKVTQ